jgi:tetratricopeptide (TPR) repeat protein
LDWTGGKEDAAVRHLSAVLHDNPRASDALLLQGKIALHHGRGKEAVQAFRTVLRDQPDLADAHALLGQSYLILGETNLAHNSLEQAIRSNPRQFEAHVALANLDMASGRKKEARERLEHVLAVDPTNVSILGLLLTMQTADRDWSASADTLARMRASGASEPLSSLAEGYLHQSRQEPDQAFAAFERAVQSAPDSPEPLTALVRLDVALGRHAQAQQRLTALLSAKPSHPYAHGLLGELYLLSHDEAAAERHLQEATAVNPEWITPWVNWAALKFSKNRSDEAQTILRRGISANPSGEILRVILATSYSDTGRIDQAIAEYQAILAHNTSSVVAANNLAALLAEYKADARSLEQALALSRDFEKTAPNPMFLDTLAWVHHKMGHSAEAVRVMKEAVAKAPEHPVLNYHAGAVYHQAGLVKEAKVYLERALRSGKGFPGDREAKTLLASVPK